jgi:geranylgeranyl diphosphate synthase, type I
MKTNAIENIQSPVSWAQSADAVGVAALHARLRRAVRVAPEEGEDSDEWFGSMQAAIETRLEIFFEEKEGRAAGVLGSLSPLVGSIRELTMRRGKRLRPALMIAGFQSVAPGQDLKAITNAALSAELLQTFLLIHDDWMDQDDMRRGHPTVHKIFSAQYGDERAGASAAILAGNLAAAYAAEVLTSAPFPSDIIRQALRAFWEMEEQVAFGQFLDITGRGSVQTVHSLKSASYSVRGPVRIGALLGRASKLQLAALDRFGWALGNAFQLRDDLLCTFGNPVEMGKPVGSDLRNGRRTALVADALEHASEKERSILMGVLGNQAASAQALSVVAGILETCGSRNRVEARLQRYVEQSIAALDSALLSPAGVKRLRALAQRVSERSR